VEAFQPVCEVQSDKASIEITSRWSGVVQRLYHTKGDMVKVRGEGDGAGAGAGAEGHGTAADALLACPAGPAPP
jgi:pyruvate/2-oxoglutarate dehydrogenase complex dihydrolipoamide acyltransferase (E2) component